MTPPPQPPGPFDQWYDQAGVRGGLRRVFQDETDQGKVFFPGHLVGYLDHPLVKGLEERRREELTLRHLYQFLIATTHVETRVVNEAAARIADGRSGARVSAAERMDAYKIYCDEGYHALYSLDLADQIAAGTGIAVPDWDYGGFVTRLAATGARLLPGEPVLAGLLQAVVFETLITAVLNQLPADPTVVTTVRDLMRDHARDEGRHHRFFAAFFHQLWHDLDQRQRTAVVAAFPELVDDCLAADLPPARASLAAAGLDADSVEQVLHESFTADPERVRGITRATMRMCRSAGVFDLPGAAERFQAAGLDPETD